MSGEMREGGHRRVHEYGRKRKLSSNATITVGANTRASFSQLPSLLLPESAPYLPGSLRGLGPKCASHKCPECQPAFQEPAMQCWVSLTSPLLGSKQACPKQVCQNAYVSVYLPLSTLLGAEKEERSHRTGPCPRSPVLERAKCREG